MKSQYPLLLISELINNLQHAQYFTKLDVQWGYNNRADHSTGGEDNSKIMLLQPELFAIQAMEGLAVEGAEVDILWDIWQGNQDGQQEELIAQAAWVLKFGCTTSAKSVCADEWALQNGILTFWDHIHVPNVLELCQRIVEQHHDSQIARHSG
ncbi:hypothetical protein E4T56_gene8085 [Termitomyces sp. T112]|nr:hypothetical protein E4T56_gene8085 [Termitomyces sp. T112]